MLPLRIGREIAVNAHPVHLAAAQHLILADNRNVVLALTRDDAGAAADARVQIHGHAPLVQRRLLRLVERIRIKRLDDRRLDAVKFFLREIRLLDEFFQVRLAHRRTAFHGPMMLRAGQRVSLAGLFHRRAGLDIFAGENLVGVEADAVPTRPAFSRP
jgi:hypothetical protein